MGVERVFGRALQDGLQPTGVREAEDPEPATQRRVHTRKNDGGTWERSEGEGLLRGRSGCADDRERFGQHALEAGVRVEIHGGHEAYEFDLTSATLGHTSY